MREVIALEYGRVLDKSEDVINHLPSLTNMPLPFSYCLHLLRRSKAALAPTLVELGFKTYCLIRI